MIYYKMIVFLGYLYHTSQWLAPDLGSVENTEFYLKTENVSSLTKTVGSKASKINILGALTKPLTKKIIQVSIILES